MSIFKINTNFIAYYWRFNLKITNNVFSMVKYDIICKNAKLTSIIFHINVKDILCIKIFEVNLMKIGSIVKIEDNNDWKGFYGIVKYMKDEEAYIFCIQNPCYLYKASHRNNIVVVG